MKILSARKDRDAWSISSEAIGDLIRAARKRLGLTQKQLARKLHVANGTLLGWETGRHHPTAAGLTCLGAFFGEDFASSLPRSNA